MPKFRNFYPKIPNRFYPKFVPRACWRFNWKITIFRNFLLLNLKLHFQTKVLLGTSFRRSLLYSVTLFYHPSCCLAVLDLGFLVWQGKIQKDGSGSFDSVTLAWRHGLPQSERDTTVTIRGWYRPIGFYLRIQYSIDDIHRVLPTTFEDFDPSLLVGTAAPVHWNIWCVPSTNTSNVYPRSFPSTLSLDPWLW